MTKRLRVYPSSAAFMWGTVVYTEYSSGCLRRIYIDANGIKEPFDPKHSERGEINEVFFEKRFERDKVTFEREVPFRESIHSTSLVLSGRIDYRIVTPDLTYPLELKSTESSTQRRVRIQNGEWGLGQVAQLSEYMLVDGAEKGKLVVTYYERDAEGKLFHPKPHVNKRGVLHLTEREFKVEFGDGGYIYVDNVRSPYTAYDVLNHIYWAARVIEDDIIWERPANYEAPFGSPCSYCPFRSTCTKWDDGLLLTAGEFLTSAKSDLNIKE